MDGLTGALVAALVGWLSIVAASLLRLPGPVLARLRVAGGASLAGIALALLGVPVPAWVPVALLAGGVAAGLLVWARVRRARRAARGQGADSAGP